VVLEDRLAVPLQRDSSVLIDVTTVIGAEDFILSQNRGTIGEDPFARQCFVEIIQSLIFMSTVFVAHPTLSTPKPGDFGEQPRLLQVLIQAGLVLPLQLDAPRWKAAAAAEAATLHMLKSPQGTRSVLQFVEQAIICDNVQQARRNSLSRRIYEWNDFQARKVRVPGHHADRITTSDGIEDDDYGLWARAVALALEGTLRQVAAVSEQKHLMATLARGLRYKARAEVMGTCYQSHPMRRDFSLTFQLNQDNTDNNSILDLIKAVRGIHQSLTEAAGPSLSPRMRLLELELPLLGGRLWTSSETQIQQDDHWIETVVERIADYRDEATELRHTVEQCVTDEDFLRVARDIEEVKEQLLDRLGLRRAEASTVERELVDDVASVVQATTGVPKVAGLWFGTKSLSKQLAQFKIGGAPYQQFLYREFVRAWKSAGR
jgi:hypothetical protein